MNVFNAVTASVGGDVVRAARAARTAMSQPGQPEEGLAQLRRGKHRFMARRDEVAALLDRARQLAADAAIVALVRRADRVAATLGLA